LGIPTAISPVDFFAGAEKERGPGQIVIEIEDFEVDSAHAGQPNEDEILGQARDRRMETSHLPVKLIAVRSVFAAKDDEERLMGLPRDLQGLGVIGLPGGRLGTGANGRRSQDAYRQGKAMSRQALFHPIVLRWVAERLS
jgi:hypothetical protein